MARDNDKGLYLPLKVDLTEWEKSLAQADADLQKAMRKLKSETSNLRLQYDVQIAGAKAAGNDIKALELENQKLNAIYEAQKQAVEVLNKAYQKSVKEKGADAEASKALAKQLIMETKAMERTKAQIDGKGFAAIGKNISNGFASISPEFAKIRTAVAGITGEMSKMGTTALTAAKALGGIGVVAAGLGAAYGGIKALIDGYKETAEAAANANEEVYQLREELNTSYETAELLAGAARVDGVNLQSLNTAVNQLYKNLDAGNEKGKRALAVLQEYGATITDVSGKRKDVVDMFSEIQKAFLNAEAMGKGRDFLTTLFGASNDQFLHFIRGFDYYIEKAREAQSETSKEYDLGHQLLDLKKQQAEAERQLTAARGDAFISGAVEAQKAHNAGLTEQIKLYNDAKDSLKGYADEMKNLAIAEEGASLAWEKFKISLQAEGMKTFDDLWKKLKDVNDEYEKLQKKRGMKFMPGSFGIDAIMNAVSGVKNAEKEITEQMDEKEYQAEIDNMQAVIDEKERKQEQEARAELKRTEDKLKKEAEIEEKYQKALRDLTANEYEKQVYAIEDKRKANMKEGMSEVQAQKLFTIEKEKIDKAYFERLQKQREADAKKAEDIQKKQIESQKSDAERVLTQQKELWQAYLRYGDSGKFQEVALNQQLKKLGIDKKDYDMMDDWKLQGFKDAMKRFADDTWLSKFNDIMPETANVSIPAQSVQAQAQKPSVQNQITVNIDRPILTDENLLNQLTDKVAEKITVVAERAFGTQAQNAF